MSFNHVSVKDSIRNDHVLTQIGLNAWDFRSYNPKQMKNKIMPVIIVPKDMIHREQGVREAIDSFKELLEKINDWFLSESGMYFDYVHPVVLISNYSSGYWIALSEGSVNSQQDRFNYYWKAVEEIHIHHPMSVDISYFGTVYIGGRTDVTEGAGDGRGVEYPPILPPSTLAFDHGKSYKSMSANQKRIIWASAHELGHQFGLDHPDERNQVDFGQSFMGIAELPHAKILRSEKLILSKSNYLRKA